MPTDENALAALDDLDALVVRLIDDGRTRSRIAELAGVDVGTVREIVRESCERYNCRMDLLPVATGYRRSSATSDASL